MKYFIDEVVKFKSNACLKDEAKGFFITVKDGAALLEVPSDIYGDPDNLYEESLNIKDTDTFNATYENGDPIHMMDGTEIGEDVWKKAMIWPIDEINYHDEDEELKHYVAGIDEIEYKIDLFNCYIYKFPEIATEQELLNLVPGLKEFDCKDDLETFMDEAGIEYSVANDDEDPVDMTCYDFDLKETFNLEDCDTVPVFEYWDGSNMKQIWLGDNTSPEEIIYEAESIDIDEWDGRNHYYRTQFNHGRIHRLIERDGEAAENEYILYEYTQYASDIPTVTFISEKEMAELTKED